MRKVKGFGDHPKVAGGSGGLEKLNLPKKLKAELDAIASAPGASKRWTAEADALLVHYAANPDISIKTLCAILKKAYPRKEWPYSVVNARRRYLRRREES